MANRELVNLLRRGVKAWNSWRQENPGSHINLNDATSSAATLIGVDFASAFLIQADLGDADLSQANLSHALLRGANCCGARLFEADLGNSDLFGADLGRADLRRARLNSVFLKRTRLHGADLREVTGLTQDQLDEASGDDMTKLPNELLRPVHWVRALDNSRDLASHEEQSAQVGEEARRSA